MTYEGALFATKFIITLFQIGALGAAVPSTMRRDWPAAAVYLLWAILFEKASF